jgi:NAD(P)-dependent dehydrogenase (short-subunit alcohol dehydrogenase family)
MPDDVIAPGNTALVTGAAMGIGRAACRAFAARGMNVCLADLPGDRLDAATREVADLAEGTAGAVLKIAADVGDPVQVAQMHRAAVERFGGVDLLMNNAATRIGRGHGAEIAAWRKAMEVNFWGIVEAVRAFLPDMAASGRRAMIVNVGSKQGITNPPGHPIYNVAKSAVKTYTEALEHELRTNPDYGGRITAHLLIPGWTTTGDAEHKPGAWLPE